MRHLQLNRSNDIYDNRDLALAAFDEREALVGASGEIHYDDGEPVVFMYKSEDGDDIYGILGISYSKGDEVGMYKIDVGPFDYDTIKKLNWVNEIEQVVSANTNYTEDRADIYRYTNTDVDGNVTKTSEFGLTYTPISPLALTVPQTIGDIEIGTTAEELNGKKLSKLLDDIIFKTIYPTITEPSSTISFKSGFTNGAIYQIGITAPTTANLQTTLNRGKVVVDDGVTADKYYVGTKSGETFSVSGAVTKDPLTSSEGVITTGGTYTYKGVTYYNAGPTMSTSKGATNNPMRTSAASGKTDTANFVTNPHPAGSVATSNSVSIKASSPLYIGTSATTLVSQGLKAWGSMTYADIVTSATVKNDSSAIVIETPRTIKSVMAFNTVSNAYDINWTSNFTRQSGTVTKYYNASGALATSGTPVTYYRYYWSGPAVGASKIQIITN